MINKIKSVIQSIINSVKLKLILLDEKFAKLITDSKLRKIMYFFVGGFLGFILLIIIVGIISLPFRKTSNRDDGLTLNKPNIINSSPVPQKELNETQKSLLNLENKIKDLKFPESILNIPVIEDNITL
jgi:hypothetical protein